MKSKTKIDRRFVRRGTRFLDNGRCVIVQLRVDRRDYEYAREWAAFHSPAIPWNTAEEELEGYLNITLLQAINESDWKPPEEIQRLYDGLEPPKYEPDMDDDIPF